MVNAAIGFVGADNAGERIGLEHAVHVDRERLLHRVGLFVGQRAHADDGFALADGADAPVDTLFAAGFDGRRCVPALSSHSSVSPLQRQLHA